MSPFLISPGKRKLYITLIVLFAIFYPTIISLSNGIDQITFVRVLFYLWIFNMFLILGVGLRSIFRWIQQKQDFENLEKEKIKSDIALLRTQLNPHFLFNTLHNIDSLIKEDQDKASQSLIRLSDIMRYMLQESQKESVPIHNEIRHIEDYISLEKLRHRNSNFISYNNTITNKEIMVAPMLFIPFVENAFKHSIESDMKQGITINITSTNEKVIFDCENYFNKLDMDKDPVHGIGLSTIEKRLGLLYPEKHKLNIQDKDSVFKVHMEIDTNEN